VFAELTLRSWPIRYVDEACDESVNAVSPAPRRWLSDLLDSEREYAGGTINSDGPNNA
jgi:hypothetical protein